MPLAFTKPGDLARLALGFPLSKNVQDYMHLILAKERGALFLTLDKLNGQIEDLRREFYPGIAYWPEAKEVLLTHPQLGKVLGEHRPDPGPGLQR